MGRAFSPRRFSDRPSWGAAPGWDEAGLWPSHNAWPEEAGTPSWPCGLAPFGTSILKARPQRRPSLGQRKENTHHHHQGLKARPKGQRPVPIPAWGSAPGKHASPPPRAEGPTQGATPRPHPSLAQASPPPRAEGPTQGATPRPHPSLGHRPGKHTSPPPRAEGPTQGATPRPHPSLAHTPKG
jgi:hypothetical protein